MEVLKKINVIDSVLIKFNNSLHPLGTLSLLAVDYPCSTVKITVTGKSSKQQRLGSHVSTSLLYPSLNERKGSDMCCSVNLVIVQTILTIK